jgi:uncharacterized membrane protein
MLSTVVRGLARALIPLTSAQGFTVTTWGYGDRTWQSILQSIVTMLKGTITMASVAVFVAGAFLFTISAGQPDRQSRGKNMMIGALIALGIVLGAQAILRTTSYFIWG